MLNIWSLSGHGLWISGLALLLTIGSFQSWERVQPAAPLDEQTASPMHLGGLLGLLFVTSGLLLVSASLLERGVWGLSTLILAGVLGHTSWRAYQRRSRLARSLQPGTSRPQQIVRQIWAAPHIRWLSGIVISLIAIYLTTVGLDYRSVWANLVQANLALLVLALVSISVNNIAKAVRWKILMSERGAAVSMLQALRLHLIGQMLNSVLPARAGDLSRAYMTGDLGVARTFVLGTVAVEKIIDMLCYVLIFALLLLLMPLPAWVSQPAYLLVVFTALAVGAIIVVLLYRRGGGDLSAQVVAWLPAHLRERVGTMLTDGLESIHVLTDSHKLLRVALWSVLIWLTAALTNYGVLAALGIVTSPVAALFSLFVLVAGINLPSAPGNIGVFEYLCVLALAVFGVERTAALSFGVLLHVLVLLPPALGGLAAVWLGGQRGTSDKGTPGEPPTVVKKV